MRIAVNILFSLLFVLFLNSAIFPNSAYGQSELYKKLWNDPEIQERIENGIETHRMGWGELQFVDDNGNRVTDVSVNIRQISHDFLFGANIFMLDGFSTEEKNRKYEGKFTDLFNSATLPFYWRDLEPQPGVFRYGKDSPTVYRRPPPDLALEFCKKHHLTPVGHPMVWDHPRWSIPDWLPEEASVREKLINDRIRQLSEHYGDIIPIWDVVNEINNRYHEVIMPDDFAFKAFKTAGRHLPAETVMRINEMGVVWNDKGYEYSPFYVQIENFLHRGARMDAIGFQAHLMSRRAHERVVEAERMLPKDMYAVLDRYSDFKKPIHITEITIPTIPDNREGEKLQAIITENFYKLWFSHPKVEGITWWNLADGTATPNEDPLLGGLLRHDLSPKPSYRVLENLIRSEWKTEIHKTGITNSDFKFKGFYGRYLIQAIHHKTGNKVEKEIHLSKTGKKTFIIQFCPFQ